MTVTNSYRVDVAKVFGPLSAIYIDMLLKFGKLYEDDISSMTYYVPLERDFIFNYSGIDYENQEKVEDLLVKLGMLATKKFKGNDNKSHYYLSEKRLNALMGSANSFSISNISSMVEENENRRKKEDKKETKKEELLKQLKSCIDAEDVHLRKLLYDWVDSVIGSGKYLTVQSVKLNIDALNKFTSDPKIKEKIVKTATINSWRDFQWAMKKVKSSDVSGNNFANYSDIKAEKNSLLDEAF